MPLKVTKQSVEKRQENDLKKKKKLDIRKK